MSADRTAEILNYLSAMSREMGEFRSENKARFDTLEMRAAVLESGVGALARRFDVLDARVEKLDARMERFDARMERLEAEMHRGFDAVRRDVRRLNHKFEAVSEDVAELKMENRDLNKRVEVIEKKVGITDDL